MGSWEEMKRRKEKNRIIGNRNRELRNIIKMLELEN